MFALWRPQHHGSPNHPKILTQSDPTPIIDLSVADIRWQIANGQRQRNCYNGQLIRNRHRSFERYDRWLPTTFRSPNGSQMYRSWYVEFQMAISPQRVIRSTQFRSSVGFSGSADRMALFPVRSNPSRQPAAILEKFEWPYLRNWSSDPLLVWFHGVGFSGSADRMALFPVRWNPRWRPWHDMTWHDRRYGQEPSDVAFCQLLWSL